MKDNKNYITYILIAVLIILGLYALHQEETIGELKSQVSYYKEQSSSLEESNLELEGEKANNQKNSIEEKLDSIESIVDDTSGKVDELYNKLIPENERQKHNELVVVPDN